MSVRKEIIYCSELGTTRRIDIADLPTGENLDLEQFLNNDKSGKNMNIEENVDNDISELLELAEDEYSGDVFESGIDKNDEIDNDNLVATENEYIKNVLACTGLHVIQQNTVLEAWHNRGPIGLFHLFLTFQDVLR